MSVQEEAAKEFFKHVLHINRVDWKAAELKYGGWNDRTPNLIKILKGE